MKDLILSRSHAVYSSRKPQISLNAIAFRGGRKYVDSRLWRQPNETDLSWTGKTSTEISVVGTVGRKERACCVNDAGRVANKISQYLFKNKAKRDGINEAFEQDCTGTGTSITSFWMDICDQITTCQWCWVQIDYIGQSTTLAEKLKSKGIVWRLWNALSVPDWRFGSDGKLDWIILESYVYENEDPTVSAESHRIRTLFRRMEGKVYCWEFAENASYKGELRNGEQIAGYTEIPFILIGKISDEGWWFDDIENMQAQCMNLDSLNNENLSKGSYPQLVIPSTMVESLEMKIVNMSGQTNGKADYGVIRELVRGLEFPFVESAEESGTSRYISPPADLYKGITEELTRKRSLLFDTAGLALFNKESRQMQTAESKQFDHLDTASTLSNRALLMQEAEVRLVEMSKTIDRDFKEYSPVWPQDFSIVDVTQMTAAIMQVGNQPDLTPSMRKMVLVAGVRMLEETCKFDSDLVNEAMKEIEEMTVDVNDTAIDTTTYTKPKEDVKV
jgi:hypothetical protein